jgi:hypothetical protein
VADRLWHRPAGENGSNRRHRNRRRTCDNSVGTESGGESPNQGSPLPHLGSGSHREGQGLNLYEDIHGLGLEDKRGADPRFAYVTIASPDRLIPIYAPAPMLLVGIRPKDTASVPNQFAMRATDWDLTFVVSCNTQVRINHITEPSQRVRDAWGFPGLFATWWLPDGTQVSSEERQVPMREVRFKPGDVIGYTQGTVLASNFDYVVAVNDISVCPWSVFNEPLQTEIMEKLGPKMLSPNDGPVPGWPCQGYGDRA